MVGPAQPTTITLNRAAARRGLTPFVGRDAELEQLWGARRLAAASHGQIVALVGEPGVGKSRLVYEFIQSQDVHGWRALEGDALSYGRATSYLPVIDLLRGFFKIADRADAQEIRDRVTERLRARDRSLEPALPALLTLFDVPANDDAWTSLSPGQRRQRTLDAVRRLLLCEAREQPLVVIFEDLHWIDAETQAVLDTLVDSLGSARLLLIVSYRPEYQHAWGSKTFYSQIRLDRLLPESAEELLSALLGDDPGLGPLKELLIRRGNPAFLEETVRTLVESKALVGKPGDYRLTRQVHTIQVSPSDVERFDRMVAVDGAKRGLLFGCPIYVLDGERYATLYQGRLVLRLSPGDAAELIAKGGRPFEPIKGRRSKDRVVVPDKIVANSRSFQGWVRKGRRLCALRLTLSV